MVTVRRERARQRGILGRQGLEGYPIPGHDRVCGCLESPVDPLITVRARIGPVRKSMLLRHEESRLALRVVGIGGSVVTRSARREDLVLEHIAQEWPRLRRRR